MEQTIMFKHTEILNYLIKEHNYKSYLEIGVGDPSNNFLLIDCGEKYGVDPYFDYLDANGLDENTLNEAVKYRMTSDEFFNTIPKSTTFDLIFIDGLHTEEQCDKDIQNALEHLSKDGAIIIHDSNPYTKKSVGERNPTVGNTWNGDVYKSVVKLKDFGVEYFTLGDDFGITLVKKPENFVKIENVPASDITYDYFDKNRAYVLNLVSETDFLRKTKRFKTCLCCIVKMENLYLRDFVEYYKNIGFTNIVLYDNNDENGEYPQQVIGDYISNGFVIYKNARGLYRYQLEAYGKCYEEYKTQYDWMAFFDVDEYLHIISGKNISNFLSEEKFKDASVITFYWMAYGDGDKLHYENKPVYDRFVMPVHNPYENERNTFKLMIKCDEGYFIKFTDANAIEYRTVNVPHFNILDPAGKKQKPLWMYQDYTYECAYLKHYQTLTIEEFLCRRFGRRSYADNASTFNKEKVMGIFTSVNKMTPEKEKIVDEFFKIYNIKEDISPDDAKAISSNN